MKVIIANESSLPIYEQIKKQIMQAIFSGEIGEGEKLPSLRNLAKNLRISVLTVTRAYSELEMDGFIKSYRGKGYFVLPQDSHMIKEQYIRSAESLMDEAVKAGKTAGLSRKELYSILNMFLEEQHYE